MDLTDDIIIQQPKGAAQQLMLLFHGYGADASDLVPLGSILAQHFPHAYIVSVQAPELGESGMGYQWYSLLGVEEGVGERSRVPRVAQAMPAFVQMVAAWQGKSGVAPEATLLLGFSQGASMALEYAAQQQAPSVGRVVALSGRFATLPESLPAETTFHLYHGKNDAVIPYGFCVEAAKHLVAMGADVTADILPFVEHEINAEVMRLILHRLQTHIPKRTWEAALREDPAAQVKQ